jgi:hypothetical protein
MPDIEHYLGNADLFPILRKWDFFNHAAVSPLPRPASDALRTYPASHPHGPIVATLRKEHRVEIALLPGH